MAAESRGRLVARTVLLGLVVAAVAWAVAVAVTGGVVIRTEWLRLSSRDPLRPLVLAIAAALTYSIRYRAYLHADMARIRRLPWPRIVAGLAVVSALVVGIRWGTFMASGSDSYGYVSQAALWRQGTLITPAPDWVVDATWNEATWTSAPLGYRPGSAYRTLVPTYAAGLPLAMAASQAIAGPDGAFYVVPICGALAVLAAYLLGAWLGGPWSGAVAAVLLVSSPAFLFMLVQPMSDVPVAALWGLALWLALRDGKAAAVLAGLCAAAAVVTRPNLAPLCGVIGAILLLKPGGSRLRDVAAFLAGAAPGALFVAWLNRALYGSPMQSGYGRLEDLYALDNVVTNAGHYAAWLVESQTLIIVCALLAPFVIRGSGLHRMRATVLAIGFPLAVVGLYLPYTTFEEWWYLRFLLPAYPALMAGLAAVLVLLPARLPLAARALTTGGAILLVVAHGLQFHDPRAVAAGETRYLRVVDYVKALPARSVFVSLTYSGAIRHYTGRDILRWELFFEPADLDRAIGYLQRLGYAVYLVAEPSELPAFLSQFRESVTVRTVENALHVDLGGALVYPLAVGSAPAVQIAGAP